MLLSAVYLILTRMFTTMIMHITLVLSIALNMYGFLVFTAFLNLSHQGASHAAVYVSIIGSQNITVSWRFAAREVFLTDSVM